MLAFDAVSILRNNKKFETATNTNMSENSSSGNSPVMSNHKDGVNSNTEARILTQEEVKQADKELRCSTDEPAR